MSVIEPIDETPVGRFTENMLASNAQFENEIRAERTLTGMMRKFKLGLLKRVKPTDEHIALFKETVMGVWKKDHEELITQNERIEKEIKERKDLKSKLIRKNAEGVLSDEDLKEELGRLGDEIMVKKVALSESEIDEAELKEF